MAVPPDRKSYPQHNADVREVCTKQFRGQVLYLNKLQKRRDEQAYTPFTIEHSDRLQFNAILWPRPNSAFAACFYDGCGLSVSELACLLCERRDFLGFVARSFVHHHAPRYFVVRDYSWLNDPDQPQRALQYPRPEHVSLFDHVTELCTRFLYWHESAHLQLGHVQKATTLGATELAEQRLHPHPVASAQLRKWEMEADMFAMFGLLRAGRDEQFRQTAHLHTSGLLQWDCTVLAACAIMCAIFELSESAQKTPANERTHPRAAARFLNLLLRYVRFVEEGLVQREPGPKSGYYTYLWSQVLSTVAEIRLLTGATATQYDDLKGTLLKAAEGAQLTDTALECIECGEWRIVPGGGEAVPVLIPHAFAKPYAIF